MHGDGIGHGLVLAAFQRDVAADHALHFGELANRLADQIGLGQPRRALRLVRVRVHHRRDLAREPRDPVHPLAQCAELVVEGDLVELGGHRVQPARPVVAPEELGVRQPRADHALVALDDRRAAVISFDIRDEDKAVRQRAVLSAEREAFLVLFERGDEHFRRDVEKVRVEAARQHHGPFDKPCVLVDQPVVFD